MSVRDRNIAVEIVRRSEEETMSICEDLGETYNLSANRVYRIAQDEGAIDKKNRINGKYKRPTQTQQELKNMVSFKENFGIKVGRRYNVTVKNPQGTDIRYERVKCTYRRKDNWYFKFDGITVNRGNIITGEIKIKAV